MLGWLAKLLSEPSLLPCCDDLCPGSLGEKVKEAFLEPVLTDLFAACFAAWSGSSFPSTSGGFVHRLLSWWILGVVLQFSY